MICTPVKSEFRALNQEDPEFKANLGYVLRLSLKRCAWVVYMGGSVCLARLVPELYL